MMNLSGKIQSASATANSGINLVGAISSATSLDAIMGDATTTAFNMPAYHELLENPHVELDGLQRLQENLAQLEDLHGRLRFMMRDLTGLIRRR